MQEILHIKNMVCDRCKATVLQELQKAQFDVVSVELGEVRIRKQPTDNLTLLEASLQQHGFEMIQNERAVLVEEIKICLIKKLENQREENSSIILEASLKKSYSSLSKIFSKTEGITIEKYEINLKIEKAKELIQLGQFNFSEIAYSLQYTSSSHLAKQFKSITGMSMTDYKSLQDWGRKTVDKIV